MPKRLMMAAAALLVLMALGCSFYFLMNSRTFQLFGELVSRVPTSEKAVALTFDDGPNERTDEILKILDEAGVKATFFLIGENVERYPEEAKKIAQAGHELGNHTYTHSRMIFKPMSFIAREIEATDRLLREAGYQGEILFRPPFGKKLAGLPYYLASHSRKTIMWDVEPDSYAEIAQNRDAIVQHVMANAKPGSIILLHVWSGSTESLDAVKGIVAALKARGYAFKTVSELLAYEEK